MSPCKEMPSIVWSTNLTSAPFLCLFTGSTGLRGKYVLRNLPFAPKPVLVDVPRHDDAENSIVSYCIIIPSDLGLLNTKNYESSLSSVFNELLC